MLTADGRHCGDERRQRRESAVLSVQRPCSRRRPGLGRLRAKSVTEHDGLVYVLNTGAPSLVGFRLAEGGLEAVEGSRRQLVEGADPAQVGFSPDGRRLLVTQRGTDAIVVYPVDAAGLLGEPVVRPSAGPTPYGFAFAGDATLVVTEAFGAMKGKAAASSYALRNGSVAPVSASVGNGRSEICWAVTSPDGKLRLHDELRRRCRLALRGRPRRRRSSLEDAAAGLAVDGENRASRRGHQRRRPVPLCDRRRHAANPRLGDRERRLPEADRVLERPPGNRCRPRHELSNTHCSGAFWRRCHKLQSRDEVRALVRGRTACRGLRAGDEAAFAGLMPMYGAGMLRGCADVRV